MDTAEREVILGAAATWKESGDVNRESAIFVHKSDEVAEACRSDQDHQSHLMRSHSILF